RAAAQADPRPEAGDVPAGPDGDAGDDRDRRRRGGGAVAGVAVAAAFHARRDNVGGEPVGVPAGVAQPDGQRGDARRGATGGGPGAGGARAAAERSGAAGAVGQWGGMKPKWSV